jgi:hypothetical protein
MRIRRVFSLRRNLVIMLAVPVAAKGMALVADRLRRRHADSRAAARLDQAGRALRKVQRFL